MYVEISTCIMFADNQHPIPKKFGWVWVWNTQYPNDRRMIWVPIPNTQKAGKTLGMKPCAGGAVVIQIIIMWSSCLVVQVVVIELVVGKGNLIWKVSVVPNSN